MYTLAQMTCLFDWIWWNVRPKSAEECTQIKMSVFAAKANRISCVYFKSLFGSALLFACALRFSLSLCFRRRSFSFILFTCSSVNDVIFGIKQFYQLCKLVPMEFQSISHEFLHISSRTNPFVWIRFEYVWLICQWYQIERYILITSRFDGTIFLANDSTAIVMVEK